MDILMENVDIASEEFCDNSVYRGWADKIGLPYYDDIYVELDQPENREELNNVLRRMRTWVINHPEWGDVTDSEYVAEAWLGKMEELRDQLSDMFWSNVYERFEEFLDYSGEIFAPLEQVHQVLRRLQLPFYDDSGLLEDVLRRVNHNKQEYPLVIGKRVIYNGSKKSTSKTLKNGSVL